ncbi:DNA topoisomerase 3-alpha isoform X1 [Oryza glaberrima]|uniref:DNA topoisomerase 3-alpha isoform X1 n=1 Tax=Oryza glaberrima TaxID=4538 RepID=UPI00224C4208|nr:DNA topoisomerase 3-alpha isoform X1 [Oryza glaberrima]XP_052149295.1 DNA topoisomerase 3-alpha isoform X1 [Oryza glaberrima]XP_052149296.1 DNA topoisomerase 3-alpha isoform X1 [Oryza glaberrima]XP_052149297.1 DNA topoisomerase 3-alpha isoform X1 [Oryza glaberrima]XP_052149298.1 DNA topoisomerase 3-alpha isoform X1 [Oryza glaberrima]XP_052149299.1 DNA topoisomerase 3-alpha isoform X1 [Oryza glaberrima]
MHHGGGGGAIRVLNVAEKPSVAKSVAEILSRPSGGMRSREGRSRYNRVFEFDYSIGGRACHMLVTSVTGHLMELEFDDRFRRWHSCDPADLFHAPVRKSVPQDKQDIKRTLEEEARKCQWLVLWLDCDREGENIAYEVIDICAGANSRLNIWRARFSALIDREIHEAVQHLDRPNKLFADAVDARQEIDLRIGASFTRFQTMLLKDAFVLDDTGDDRNIILSYGPCQFPTLGFIVERFWEIQAHEPEEFWTINCSHTSDEGTASFGWIRGHLFDYSSAVVIYEMCVEEPMATVQNVRNQEKLKYPPYPLSTIELQKRASRYFRMSSEHTMKVAEELYQAGFISYPRTETDNFSPNTDLHSIVHEQVAHPNWGTYAQRLLDPEARLWRNPSNGGHDDKAHPPIHPTKFSAGETNWTDNHKKLYELVVRHFLACCSQPAVGAETTVEIDIASEQFNASGRVVLAKNYLDVYRFDSWGGTLLPTYIIGQQFVPTTLTLDSGMTRPPPLLAEADLLGCMDKAGIGTDATMHDHIKKLLDRCYATKDANTRFSPTNLGEALVMGYDEMGYELWKPYLRSMMEADMKSVSIGTKSKSEVLENCLQQMKACFLDARANKVKLFDAMGTFFARSSRPVNETQNSIETVRPCAACNESEMFLKQRPTGEFMVGCRGFPQCRNVVWLPRSLSGAAVTDQVCPTCAPGPVYKIQFKFRRRDIPPNFDVDHLGCIGGCDDILKELMELSRFGSHSQTATPARNQSQTASGVRQGSSRQDLHTSFHPAVQFTNGQTPVVNSQGFRSTHTQSSGNASGQVQCTSCREPCVLRTANTEANRGRKFYKCQNLACGFFAWEDDVENSAPRGRGGRGRGGRSGSRQSSASASAGRRGGTQGRGRRGRGRNADGMMFVAATGEPVYGSCFICGDPTHFANVCPNLGR